ncbi:hypothetical protein P9112_009336 [Eukaryota sp. TZLM1-RC]
MFISLIKLIYFEYLQYLKNLFGVSPYAKVRIFTKSGISKKVAKFAKQVIDGFEFLRDPHDLNLNENICDLQLCISTDFKGPKVINTRIQKLDVYYNEVDYDVELLSLFPNVEVVKLRALPYCNRLPFLNLAHLSNLKCLELDGSFNIEQLPTSLVKLVLKHSVLLVSDLSYLTSLKELVCFGSSRAIVKGEILLPQCIVRLEVEPTSASQFEIQLPNLKELIFHGRDVANFTEQNFPSLKFVRLIKPDNYSMSVISPIKHIEHGVIVCVKLIKNSYLVELSCFPWWIQYPVDRPLSETFRDCVVET